MRTEKEMLELIIETAQKDERIRAVCMNGSRANPTIPHDIFQDYDIVYVVEEIASFLDDPTWIDVFGQRLMMQLPDQLDMDCGRDCDITNEYTYLMLFTDGNRIDLKLYSLDKAREDYENSTMTIILLDKDNQFPQKPCSDEAYWVQRPDQAHFTSTCNDFWWCLQNVVKGIWRGELPYAKDMFDNVVRSCLNTMCDWAIAYPHDFHISTGKQGKYYPTLLHKEEWALYAATYSNADPVDFYKAIDAGCELFSMMAKRTAAALQLSYCHEEEQAMRCYIDMVKTLDPEAKELKTISLP